MSSYRQPKSHENLFFQGKHEDMRRVHDRMAVDSSIAWLAAALVLMGIVAGFLILLLTLVSINLPVVPCVVVAICVLIAGMIKVRHIARLYHEVGNHRTMGSHAKKEILEKFTVHHRLLTMTSRAIFARDCVSVSYYFADLNDGVRANYCILFIKTSSAQSAATHDFLMLSDALADGFSQQREIPKAAAEACVSTINKSQLGAISFSGESGKRVAMAMVQQHPHLMMHIKEYDADIMVAWVKFHLHDIMLDEEFDAKNMIQNVAKSLHRLPTGRFLPVDLIVRLTDYCTSDEGFHCMEGFYRWFWLTTRRPSSKLMRKVNDNAWMLANCVSNVLAPSEVTGYDESVNEAFCHVVKSIIQRVGLAPNASEYKGAAVGYARLFGAEAAMKKFPNSGREILMDDLDI
jgi:hypothetical protein